MTWILIGIIGALTTVVAVLSGATWWLGKKAIEATERVLPIGRANIDLQERYMKLDLQQEKTVETLKNVQNERDRQNELLSTLREQLEEALSHARNDPPAAAARIQHSLDKLRALSSKMSDVPGPEPDEND